MSFLKKLGQILAAGLQLVGLFPIVQPFFGAGKAGEVAKTAVNDFTAIGSVVVQIETALQGKPGLDKLAAAVPLVRQIIQTSEAVSGHHIKNEAEFSAAVTDITNGVVRLYNALDTNQLSTTGQPAVAPAAPAIPVTAIAP